MAWPTLTIAVNEISNVRCTATIGLFLTEIDVKNSKILKFIAFATCSKSTMGVGQLFVHSRQIRIE